MKGCEKKRVSVWGRGMNLMDSLAESLLLTGLVISGNPNAMSVPSRLGAISSSDEEDDDVHSTARAEVCEMQIGRRPGAVRLNQALDVG